MKNSITSLACVLALGFASANATADVINFTWKTTVSETEGGHPAIVGETITTIIAVDNGGSTLAGQTWDQGSFLSYRIEGASGWSMTSTSDLDASYSFGGFTTDANGVVVTAPRWIAEYPNAAMMTSWAGVTTGGWWNNGANQVACSMTAGCVWAANVNVNQLGSSWTAAFAEQDSGEVPEPGSLALLTIGAFALARRRTRK